MSFFVDPREAVTEETVSGSGHQGRSESGATNAASQSGDETSETVITEEVDVEGEISDESELIAGTTLIPPSAHQVRQQSETPGPVSLDESHLTSEASKGAASAKTKAESYDIIESGKMVRIIP